MVAAGCGRIEVGGVVATAALLFVPHPDHAATFLGTSSGDTRRLTTAFRAPEDGWTLWWAGAPVQPDALVLAWRGLPVETSIARACGIAKYPWRAIADLAGVIELCQQLQDDGFGTWEPVIMPG
jgi:hypothetical protein